MIQLMPRKEAINLQHQIVDVILGRKEHGNICAIIFSLSESYWSKNQALPIAERMALLACEAAQKIPEYIKNPYDHPEHIEAYESLEKKYNLFGRNVPEYATKHGPYEEPPATWHLAL